MLSIGSNLGVKHCFRLSVLHTRSSRYAERISSPSFPRIWEMMIHSSARPKANISTASGVSQAEIQGCKTNRQSYLSQKMQRFSNSLKLMCSGTCWYLKWLASSTIKNATISSSGTLTSCSPLSDSLKPSRCQGQHSIYNLKAHHYRKGLYTVSA